MAKIIETIYATIRIDFERRPETTETSGLEPEEIAALVCDRANSHNHTIEGGVKIENVELSGLNTIEL